MNQLPSIISQNRLRHAWTCFNTAGEKTAIIARYEDSGKKKRFHQYRCNESGNWVEGVETPRPLFGLESLVTANLKDSVYIFEGEKCAAAAQSLGLAAITSIMGSNQAKHADWEVLKQFPGLKKIILVPDQDNPGMKYMQDVSTILNHLLPSSSQTVLELPFSKTDQKGFDLIDWILEQKECPPGWDGFQEIQPPHADYLRQTFTTLAQKKQRNADEYFSKATLCQVEFAGDPEPIKPLIKSVLPCPIATLPDTIARWLKAQAEHMQISDDFLAVPFMVYTGSLIGRKRGLKMRSGTDWSEFPNLWGMLVGRPSVMKSPAMEAALKPLSKLSQQARKVHELQLAEYQKEHQVWKICTKSKEEVFKKKYKSVIGNNHQPQIDLASEEEPKKPTQKRYKTSDPTIEKIGEVLSENPQGILLDRDELAGWLHSFDKGGRESDRQFYLESWSGKKDFDVDRIGRGSLHIPALFLSIFGSIQPGPLAKYVHSSIHGGAADDGFLQRFSMMVWPDVKSDWELIPAINIESEEEAIFDVYDHLDKLDFNPENGPHLLNFTKEAQEAFNSWQQKLECNLRSNKWPAHLEAHYAKFKKTLPALCLILEHLHDAVRYQYPQTIQLSTFHSAIKWLRYLASHANRIYDSGASIIPEVANRLLAHIRSGDLQPPFTARDIYHGKHWSGLTNQDEVEEVLSYLMDKNYLACEITRTVGRPSKKYCVHPKFV